MRRISIRKYNKSIRKLNYRKFTKKYNSNANGSLRIVNRVTLKNTSYNRLNFKLNSFKIVNSVKKLNKNLFTTKKSINKTIIEFNESKLLSDIGNNKVLKVASMPKLTLKVKKLSIDNSITNNFNKSEIKSINEIIKSTSINDNKTNTINGNAQSLNELIDIHNKFRIKINLEPIRQIKLINTRIIPKYYRDNINVRRLNNYVEYHVSNPFEKYACSISQIDYDTDFGTSTLNVAKNIYNKINAYKNHNTIPLIIAKSLLCVIGTMSAASIIVPLICHGMVLCVTLSIFCTIIFTDYIRDFWSTTYKFVTEDLCTIFIKLLTDLFG